MTPPVVGRFGRFMGAAIAYAVLCGAMIAVGAGLAGYGTLDQAFREIGKVLRWFW